MAKLLQIAISIATLAAAGLVLALLACVIGRWKTARRIAGVSSLAGLFGFMAIFGLTIYAGSMPGGGPLLPGAPLDPSRNPADKARAMVESISSLTNSAALGILAALGGAVVWGLVRWRLRLAQKNEA